MQNAERALATIRSLVSPPGAYGDGGWGSYLGDGVLLCGVCGGPVRGWSSPYSWDRDLRTSTYNCGTDGCRRVSAPVFGVDGELQRLTRERLSDPGVVAQWQAKRILELDWTVATGRQVWAWLAGSGNARELKRLLDKDLQSTMQALRDRMLAVVTERARLDPAGRGRPIAELAAAHQECGTYKANGRSRQRHDRFWGLLAGNTWFDAVPAVLPNEDPMLWEDWPSTDRDAWRRRELVSIAMNGAQLGLRDGGHLVVPTGS
ncbi:hypothetical protein GCM10029964_059480 [Kibdelosporangium lantanae]